MKQNLSQRLACKKCVRTALKSHICKGDSSMGQAEELEMEPCDGASAYTSETFRAGRSAESLPKNNESGLE